MPEVYRVTPQPVAGQQGPTLIRWLDHYAQVQATAVAQMTVRDFPPWVVAQIDEATDGETATTMNFAMVVTLMARLGAAHGLRCVPLAMADAVTMTEALVRDKARMALPPDAWIGDEAVDDAADRRGRVLWAPRCSGGWTRCSAPQAPHRLPRAKPPARCAGASWSSPWTPMPPGSSRGGSSPARRRCGEAGGGAASSGVWGVARR